MSEPGGLTHASFFSGVGGLDLGLERAGWRTVSFSEIDPYACAVLAERWPGVPNLGDIVGIASGRVGDRIDAEGLRSRVARPAHEHELGGDWHDATLWTGGFPCQDLSVAGKRRGFGGDRSSLAFTFLGLVERYRPPAILLENVPGLLSSHAGRDMARLLGEMVELGYGVAYRVLDARHFGVPQRRRRVFVLGLRSGPDDPSGRVAAERAAAVLAVGTRCGRHPATGQQAGPEPATGAGGGAVGTFTAGAHPGSYNGQDAYTGHLIPSISPSPDPDRVRAADGLAGRVDDRQDLARPLLTNAKGGQRTTDLNIPLIVSPTLSASSSKTGGGGLRFDADLAESLQVGSPTTDDDPLLPLGLDSHRYRCCGNGVVASVAEWIGHRLAAVLAVRSEADAA